MMGGNASLIGPVRLLRFLSLTLVAAAYMTMVFGAYVKAIGAGLACPEWPVCSGGQLVGPLSEPAVAAEMVHRTAALLVVATGVLLLALLFAKFRSEKRLIHLTLAAALTLGVQIALGALTITSALQPLIVTSHLAIATLFFALTILLALQARKVVAVSRPTGTDTKSGSPAAEPEPPATFG
jgi:cytochrome c oxidase assembly protein subunit 15